MHTLAPTQAPANAQAQAEINDIIREFNKNIIIFMKYVKATQPIKNLSVVEKEIMNACMIQMHNFVATGSNSLIDSFVVNILAFHEDDIMNNNQDYLTNNTDECSGDLMKKTLVAIWSQLSPDDKTYISMYMQLLCIISRRYFNMVDMQRGA
jgi:hypothetical protein